MFRFRVKRQSHRAHGHVCPVGVQAIVGSGSLKAGLQQQARHARRVAVRALLLASLVCLLVSVGLLHAASGSDDFFRARSELEEAYAETLEQVADLCTQLDLPEQAQQTRQWRIARDPNRLTLFLPAGVDPLQPETGAPRLVHQWYARFREVRHQHAQALYELARQELQAGRPTRAFQLLHEVLHEDPDHESARQVLGYRRVNDRWRVPEGVIRSRLMRVANPQLGFDAGQYWLVETGNFSITTNHSEQAGLKLAEQLEQLVNVWRQVFFRFWSSRAALERRFKGPARTSRKTNHYRVVLFRDRTEYVDRLRKVEPRIDVTVGYYMDAKRTAYFYADGRDDDGVVYHEVTHQLFSETGRQVPGVGMQANYWIVEGIAMYMESMRTGPSYCTLGGLDAERLQYARYRALSEGYYVPLEQLVAFDRKALQHHEQIRALYSQSAGLASMLMHFDQGRYRPALVDYLAAVYQGRDSAGTLAASTGTPYPTLDQEYRRFLDVTDQDLEQLAATPVATSLSLSHTSVTDAGLAYLARHTRLEWLDLDSTQVTDAGFKRVPEAAPLNQLSLADTAITDESMPIVGGFLDLEILDLGGTRITDAGLAHLRSLSKLQQLGLANTQITDRGLAHLAGLKNLAVVDWTETGITAEGAGQLKQAIPGLNE